MRNLVKLAAIAGFGVAMSMSVAVPSYATTDNVKNSVSYFVDCLKKLGTEDTCGGPHEMDRGTASIGGGGGYSGGSEPYCGYCEHVVWEAKHDWHCERDRKERPSKAKFHNFGGNFGGFKNHD